MDECHLKVVKVERHSVLILPQYVWNIHFNMVTDYFVKIVLYYYTTDILQSCIIQGIANQFVILNRNTEKLLICKRQFPLQFFFKLLVTSYFLLFLLFLLYKTELIRHSKQCTVVIFCDDVNIVQIESYIQAEQACSCLGPSEVTFCLSGKRASRPPNRSVFIIQTLTSC